MIFKSNDNDNELFFPAGGRKSTQGNLYLGKEGYYWSQTWDDTGAPLYQEGWKVLNLTSTYINTIHSDKTTAHGCSIKFKKLGGSSQTSSEEPQVETVELKTTEPITVEPITTEEITTTSKRKKTNN